MKGEGICLILYGFNIGDEAICIKIKKKKTEKMRNTKMTVPRYENELNSRKVLSTWWYLTNSPGHKRCDFYVFTGGTYVPWLEGSAYHKK